MLNLIMVKKSVLVGLTYYHPNTSGLSHYAKILAEELIGKDYQIEIVCGQHESELAKKEVIEGVVVNRIRAIKLGKGLVMPSYFWQVMGMVKRAELVHCHLPSIESCWLGCWAKIFNKKILVTYHCYYGNPWIEVIHRPVLEWADKIVVNSTDYLDGYGLLKKFRPKIVEIHPPIRLARREKTIELNLKKKKVVGYLGRISREKNIEVLLQAMRQLPKNYVLAMAGPEDVAGEEKYKDKIMNLMTNLKDRIYRLGRLTEEEKVWFLKKCDCLVLASNDPKESFGMAVAEAITLGTPGIVNNRPGMRVPVLITKNGTMFDGTAQDLVDKILLVTAKTKDMKRKNIFKLSSFVNKYIKCLN